MYGGTKGEMERLLRDAEKYGDIVEGSLSADSFSDVVKAIDIVQEHMGVMGTTAAEASGTLSGSLGMLKGSWDNLVAGIANPDADVPTLVEDVLDSGVTVAENFIPTIAETASTLMEELPNAIMEAAPKVAEQLEVLLDENFPELADVIHNDVMPAVDKLVTFFNEKIVPAGKAVADNFNEKIMPVITKFADFVDENVMPVLGDLLGSIGDTLPTAIDYLGDIFGTVLDGLETAFEDMWAIVGPIVTWLADNIGGIVEKVGSVGGAVWGSIMDGSMAQGAMGIPGFATGGIVTGPTLAMVGEGGYREAIVPLEGPNAGAFSEYVNGGGSTTINITVNGAQDANGFAIELAHALRRISMSGAI